MRVTRLDIARDAIARSRALPAACAVFALAGALACTGPEPAGDPRPDAPESPAPPGAVRVRLAFGAEADLDLYVTGPAGESVYFANDRSRDGGRLMADRRCDASAHRVESVEFARAPAGRYRVGVDFMIRCASGVDRAPYELVAEVPGRPPIRRRGEARFGVFDSRALEFELRGERRNGD
jgi:hypothetical protein